ncbi:methylglyoxal synthase [Fusobacterium mortiferum]|jgi:methylglyoxal synthase|uniref:Methylglyoxal synthase n=2 Tax=Fusobacterium mortiferum TaxID=850 RepID=A0A414PVT8_FUSMR|nr:methylglyoxal synthase [Fusobacterium mortiferum]AVQ19922.1 methylglyoxal synthase [Fusobacterium mortiferum ATCC 9817]EEO35636.1 methylglyoxal synthase [Fusobacterium mortiferum ATCC 9817]MCF2627211.1 methylglyoxal synthase [Fusobacterium mortiferum]MCF2699280.1 methylglyoxal synthase [Fusobacterium mortiferum]MCI6382182.1 methylglyoxal synthase [Fusobacterium mortiferum]
MKKIALIAHDNMKNDLVEFTKKHVDFFKKYPLVATGTTGKRIAEATGLEIHRYQSGPIGGDQQIGADIAMNEMEAVFFFRDPLTAQPHEPDISALIRLADVHKIPIATNQSTAELLVTALKLK